MEKAHGTEGNRMFYLAVAPSFIGGIAQSLSKVELTCEDGKSWRRIVIEKPFGHDVASAVELNAALGKELQETQIYRIDHFAGKETVQDLAVFRFSNTMFEPIWNRANIELYRDYGGGDGGGGEAGGVLRDLGGASGHGSEPPGAAAEPDCDGAAGVVQRGSYAIEAGGGAGID